MQPIARREGSQQRVYHHAHPGAEELAMRVVQVNLAILRIVQRRKHAHQAAGGEIGSYVVQRHLDDAGVRARQVELGLRVADPGARSG